MGNPDKKKKDFNYFDAYIEMSDIACETAEFLKETVNGDVKNAEENVKKVHLIENKADAIYHELVRALNRAFITPLESEDLKLIGQMIDDVVDVIEDIVTNFYILNITKMREEAVKFAELICDCCGAMKAVIVELSIFKKSHKIDECIIAVHGMEEKGDYLYQGAIRRLFAEQNDSLEIFKWHRIFELMEKCCDRCEHVADTIESVILKNT